MNPFDLTGPSFLVFFWTLSIFGALSVYWLRLQTDVGGAPQQMLSDPYMLAYLRDGHPEVVRIALLTLVQEGVVSVKDREFTLAPGGAPGQRTARFRRPAVEEDVIAYLTSQWATIDVIVAASVGYEACEDYRRALEDLGYLRRQSRLTGVSTAATFIALLLGVVALIKVAVALSRGRTNVEFLFLSAAAAGWVLFKLGRIGAAITMRGKQALEATGALLAGARQRLKDASGALSAQELAWLGAAFGFSVFDYTPTNFAFWPALAFATDALKRKIFQPNTGSFWSSSCNTAVSSCGGGGSSCGGGGGCGGGGCGGCGGG